MQIIFIINILNNLKGVITMKKEIFAIIITGKNGLTKIMAIPIIPVILQSFIMTKVLKIFTIPSNMVTAINIYIPVFNYWKKKKF